MHYRSHLFISELDTQRSYCTSLYSWLQAQVTDKIFFRSFYLVLNIFISLAYSYLVTEVKCQCLSICWYEYKYWLGGHNPNDYCCVKTSGVSSNQGAALTTGDQSQLSNYYVSVWGVSIVRSLTLCPQLETQSHGQDVVSQQTVS